MARILYGLCGIGVGHAMRSRVILDYLTKHHDVMILTSLKVYDYMKQYYKNVYNIEGFEFVFKNNAIVNSKTFLKNLYKVNPDTVDTLELMKRKVDEFKPEIVMSDMETYSMYLAKWEKIPLINIDNQHYLLYGRYTYPRKYFLQYLKAWIVIKFATRKANHYLILTLPGTTVEERTNVTQISSILRKEIVKAKPKTSDYILVYQSTKSYEKLLEMLKEVNHKFIIYGFDVNKKQKNLTFKKFDDKKKFLTDLTNAKAIISNGGFTLISEALYLGKPLLVVPIKKHFEQIMNALYVDEHNHGTYYEDLTTKNIQDFILKVNQNSYTKCKKWNNEEIFHATEQVLSKLLR